MAETNQGGDKRPQSPYGPIPTAESVAQEGDQTFELNPVNERGELRKDLLAVDAIVAYCVNGRPPLAEPVRERARRRALLVQVRGSSQLAGGGEDAIRRFNGLLESFREMDRQETISTARPGGPRKIPPQKPKRPKETPKYYRA